MRVAIFISSVVVIVVVFVLALAVSLNFGGVFRSREREHHTQAENKMFLVLQSEDRQNKLLKKFIAINREVCSRHGIKYVMVAKSEFDVPPYWKKVFELRKVMLENTDTKYIMWIDSDAFFINFNTKKIDDFLKVNRKADIIISKDMPPWETGEFNAGVFFVKNTKSGLELINTWLTFYHPHLWNHDTTNKSWSTEAVWAGEEYEQGAFVKHFLQNPAWRSRVAQLPYHVLNNNACDGEETHDTITVHFAQFHKDDVKRVNKCMEFAITSRAVV